MTYQEILDLINSNLASGTEIPAIKHRAVEKALLDFVQENSSQQFDIKPIYVNSTYLGNNFDSTGLGTNLRLGWAICNQNNGTPNLGGRTIIGYGGSFTTLNAVGGAAQHTLTEGEMPTHDHDVASYSGALPNSLRISSPTITSIGGGKTSSKGGGQPHNNMQPYMVLVYIMKL
jgi:hypothetical protein